ASTGSPDDCASRARERYFSAMCAGVPRIFTSGPLDSKLRANGFWLFRFRPRPRRFCCPCLTAQMAPMLLEPVSSMPIPARAGMILLAPGPGFDRDIRELLVHGRAFNPRGRDGLAFHSEPQPAYGLRPQRRHSDHQCFSWAISGADDRSPCCEQYNLLRIGPHIRSSPQTQTAATA